MLKLAIRFRLLKDNIKLEYKLAYPSLKQLSDRLISDYLDVSWSQVANHWRYNKQIQKELYRKLKRIDIDDLAFWILKTYKHG